MQQWGVSREALRASFRQMRRLAAGPVGLANWIFGGGRLRIEWGGMAVETEIWGEEAAEVLVSGQFMGLLVRDRLPGPETVALKLEGERLHIGPLSFRCGADLPRAPQLLPIRPRVGDLLILPLRHTEDEIAQAGLAGHVGRVEARKQRAIDRALRSLRWLGLERADLERLVADHLRAILRGERVYPVRRRAAPVVPIAQKKLFPPEEE